MKKWADIKHRGMTSEDIAEVEAEVEAELLEMSLRDLREALGKTQVEVSEAASMAQSELSRVEKRSDYLLSTLRRYVKALGGSVEVTAVFNDKRVPLRV